MSVLQLKKIIYYCRVFTVQLSIKLLLCPLLPFHSCSLIPLPIIGQRLLLTFAISTAKSLSQLLLCGEMCLRVETCRCIMVLHVTPESFEQWRVTDNSHGARVWLYFTGHVNYAGHAPLTYSMWFYCHPEVWHQGMLSCRRRVRPDVYVAIIKSGFCSLGRLFWPRFLKEDQDLMFLSHVNSVLTGFSHTEERGRRRKSKLCSIIYSLIQTVRDFTECQENILW